MPSKSTSAAPFHADERGVVAIIFAFMAVAIAGFVGIAVDFARQSQANGIFRDAIDSAVLAGARLKQSGGSDEDAIAMANAFMASAKKRIGFPAEVKFQVSNGNTVVGDVTTAVPSTFLRVIGIAALPVSINSAAQFGLGPDVEMSLMLDVTGSMAGSKIEDLKDAVEDLLDIVVTDNSKDARRRVGLAPFSTSVKLNQKQFEAATGQLKKSYKGCVVERYGDDAYTDEAPGGGSFVTPLEEVSGTSCKDGREVFPLSSRKADLKKMVRELEVGGGTAGHLGTAWAWYLLSPSWAGAFDADEEPEPYSAIKEKKPGGAQKLRKIALLMTDGEYNTAYNGINSSTQAKQLCAGMREKGIEVFTVGFALGGNATAIATLKDCAGSTSNFYNATDGAALKAAFRDIALKATEIRLTR